jgi:hypothetical protein
MSENFRKGRDAALGFLAGGLAWCAIAFAGVMAVLFFMAAIVRSFGYVFG